MTESVNRVMVVGHLGHAASIREPDGVKTATMRVAATTGKGSDETTEWVNVVATGPAATLCEEQGAKGRLAWFEGSLRTREWVPKRGPNKGRVLEVTEVHATSVRFLDSKPGPVREPGEDRR